MMENINWAEWFGFAASVVVAISLMMSSILKLRWYNLLGAGMFSVYGFIIGALPVGFLNLFIVLIDIYYLMKLYREKDDFKIMTLSASDEYLKYFLKTHEVEISRLFPHFESSSLEKHQAFYLVKNAVPIGILVGRKLENDTFQIDLDYVGPQYRDFKMGHFVYQENGFFHNLGYKRLVSTATGGKHDEYLKMMKFTLKGTQFYKDL